MPPKPKEVGGLPLRTKHAHCYLGDAMAGLEDRPFDWIKFGDEIQISHRAKPVTRLRGEAAARFLARVEELDPGAAQQLMARVTGNFKRGNERRQRP